MPSSEPAEAGTGCGLSSGLDGVGKMQNVRSKMLKHVTFRIVNIIVEQPQAFSSA